MLAIRQRLLALAFGGVATTTLCSRGLLTHLLGTHSTTLSEGITWLWAFKIMTQCAHQHCAVPLKAIATHLPKLQVIFSHEFILSFFKMHSASLGDDVIRTSKARHPPEESGVQEESHVAPRTRCLASQTDLGGTSHTGKASARGGPWKP